MPPVFGPSSWSKARLWSWLDLQRDDRPAVGQRQDARLLAVEPLLEDHPVAGLAVDAPDHDLVDGVEGLAEVVADVDPLARGQPVGLQDQAERAAEDVVARLGGRAEDPALAALLDLDAGPRARASRAGP